MNIVNAAGEPANFVDGFAAITGIANFFLPAVKDVPGNSLKANQADNDTDFTILLPGVQTGLWRRSRPVPRRRAWPNLFQQQWRSPRRPHPTPLVPRGGEFDAESDALPRGLADGDDKIGVR